MRSGNGPPVLEHLAVATEHDFVHRGEVVNITCGAGPHPRALRLRLAKTRGSPRPQALANRRPSRSHACGHRRILQEVTVAAERSERADPERRRSADPRILNFRHSDRFIRPSSQTTIDATVSAPGSSRCRSTRSVAESPAGARTSAQGLERVVVRGDRSR